MNVVIFGASGKTGLALVSQALERGHRVTAYVRPSAIFEPRHPSLTVVEGTLDNTEPLVRAVRGSDVVVCALGSRDLKETSIRARGTAAIIAAMKTAAVKRLFVVSAMGIGESWHTLSWVNRLFFATFLRSSRVDHEAQESAVRSSGLDWTIVRPSGLVDVPPIGPALVGEAVRAKTSQVSRTEVAELILNHLDKADLITKAVTITH